MKRKDRPVRNRHILIADHRPGIGSVVYEADLKVLPLTIKIFRGNLERTYTATRERVRRLGRLLDPTAHWNRVPSVSRLRQFACESVLWTWSDSGIRGDYWVADVTPPEPA